MSLRWIIIALAGTWLLVSSTARAFDPLIDSPMYAFQQVPLPTVSIACSDQTIALWVKALDRPEIEIKSKAADSIALAHRRGAKGLDKTIPSLQAALDRPDQNAAVRLAIAKALVSLDARDTAASLFQQSRQGSSDLREVVEPTLAKWDFRPAREVWLQRLTTPETPRRNLVLAVQGLAVVQEKKAIDPLRALLLAPRAEPAIRLETGRALGVLKSEGSEKDAETLSADASASGLPSRLAAVSLLTHHRGDEAVRLLLKFAVDKDPSVAAVAVARLLEIDPKLVTPLIGQLTASPFAQLRALAVEFLIRQPSADHIRLLADRLGDADADVRVQARKGLQDLASKAEHREPVIAETTRVLGSGQWAGLEQATILLTLLDHKPAVKRLLELLHYNRPEVMVTAAWGLRKLAVPETLPEVVKFVAADHALHLAGKIPPDRKDVSLTIFDHQLSQLNQLLGQQKYAPAEALLRRFIPKNLNKPGEEGRAAAVWALGLIHDGKKDDALAKALEARLNDTATMPPEDPRVRWASAITMGRLKAKETLPSLRAVFTPAEWSLEPVSNACGWAVVQITGETVPLPQPIVRMPRDYFLLPND